MHHDHLDNLCRDAVVEGRKAAAGKTTNENRYICWANDTNGERVVLVNEFDDSTKTYHWSVSDSFYGSMCMLCFQVKSQNKFTCVNKSNEKTAYFDVCQDCTFSVHNYLQHDSRETSQMYMLVGRMQNETKQKYTKIRRGE